MGNLDALCGNMRGGNVMQNDRNDLISRRAAIDAVHEEFDDCLLWDESGKRTADEFEIIINRLPSAQPEPLTGKEKMIFLAAMAKEENICKQIDDEYREGELYEDSLVRACQEIERKVRGALWTYSADKRLLKQLRKTK